MHERKTMRSIAWLAAGAACLGGMLGCAGGSGGASVDGDAGLGDRGTRKTGTADRSVATDPDAGVEKENAPRP